MKEKRKYMDRKEYFIKAVQKRRKKIRKLAIDYKGVRCQIRGYDRCIEALEFHDLDSTGREFGISDRGYTRSW